MAAHNDYFPDRSGDRIIWLNNFRNKIGNYSAALGYAGGDLAAVQGDCDSSVYVLETWQGAVRTFSESGTATVRDTFYGTGNMVVVLPEFELPAVPPPPAAVLPGALTRIFAFVKNLKTRPGYNESIGEDLGVVGTEAPEAPNTPPEAKGQAKDSKVVITFRKLGHMGVWIEGQTGDSTKWEFLAIDTSNPYNDTRPLTVPNQPEKRRYRLCYWDGEPTNNWSNIIAVTFGG